MGLGKTFEGLHLYDLASLDGRDLFLIAAGPSVHLLNLLA